MDKKNTVFNYLLKNVRPLGGSFYTGVLFLNINNCLGKGYQVTAYEKNYYDLMPCKQYCDGLHEDMFKPGFVNGSAQECP